LPGHQLLIRMISEKQLKNESVEVFSTRFDTWVNELCRQQLDSRDLVTALYLNGLAPPIRERVQETIDMKSDYFVQASISSSESRSALSHLRTLAKAREAFLASQKPSVATQQQNQQRNPQSNNQSKPSSQQNGQASRFEKVPDELFRERVAVGLCGKCGEKNHGRDRCPNQRSTAPVPATTAAKRGRFNVMAVENNVEDTETVDTPKNA
jgi:hypothetical protein